MRLSGLVTKTALGVTLLLSGSAAMAACGHIQVAEWSWASGKLMAHVDKVILEKGYGCKVSLVPGTTRTTFASMNSQGRPHIASELWVNPVRKGLKQALARRRLHSINKGPITDVGEGWWIPGATQRKHPQLKTVMDVLKRPDLFPDKRDSSKGAFIGCPSRWGCKVANANMFRAFQMEKKGWKLIDPGSLQGLNQSMGSAVDRGQNWFGYYRTPTAQMYKYNDMVKLPFGIGFAGSKNWDNCIARTDKSCVGPKPSAWTKSEVNTVITDRFKKSAAPEVLTYLRKRVYDIDLMSGMIAYMADHRAGGREAAKAFLTINPETWSKWVTPAAAAKIKASL